MRLICRFQVLRSSLGTPAKAGVTADLFRVLSVRVRDIWQLRWDDYLYTNLSKEVIYTGKSKETGQSME
jgi:hypothetical protein